MQKWIPEPGKELKGTCLPWKWNGFGKPDVAIEVVSEILEITSKMVHSLEIFYPDGKKHFQVHQK